jgi:hypothetical protein
MQPFAGHCHERRIDHAFISQWPAQVMDRAEEFY